MSGLVINRPDDYSDSISSTATYGGGWGTNLANTSIYGAIETGLNQGKQDRDVFKVTLGPGLYELVRDSVETNPLSQLAAFVYDNSGNILSGMNGVLVKPAGEQLNQTYLEVKATTDYYVKVLSTCCICTGYYAFEFKSVTTAAILSDFPENNTTTASITPNGAPVVSSFDFTGDKDFIKFTVPANSDNQYYIAVAGYDANNNAISDPGVLVYKSDGTTLAVATKNVTQNSNGSADAYNIVHLKNATSSAVDYYIMAQSQNASDKGDYKVTVTSVPYAAWTSTVSGTSYDDYLPNNTSTVLALDGSKASGAINIPYDYNSTPDFDYFKLNLVAGVTYALRMEAAASSTVDPLLYLLNSSASLSSYIKINDNKGSDPYGSVSQATVHDSLILYTPTTSGIYYLAAAGSGTELGAYTVSALAIDDAAGSNQTIQRVALNRAPVEGQIEQAGDSDWYGIYLSAGATYEFKAEQSAVYALSNPLLFVRDHSGNVLALNDNASGLNAQVRFTATTSGMYYLDVQDSGSGTGRYLVSASALDDLGSNTGTTGVIDLPSAAGGAGRIDYGGDVDWLQMDLERGADYIIRVQGSASGGGLTLVDPRLLGVYDSTGVLIHNSGNDDYGNSRNAYVRFTPDQTGRYFLAIAGSSLDDIGSYRINVEKETFNDVAASTATRSLLPVGETVAGSVETTGDKDWYSVQLTQGQTYVIDLTGDVTHTQVLRDALLGGLYDASGTLIANTTNNNYGASLNSRMLHTASITGTYFIEAAGNTGYTGDYQLSIKTLASVSDAVGQSLASHGTMSLTNGQGAVNGSVDVARDVDWYAVQLTQGTLYDITLRGAASGMGSLLDPRLYGIYDFTGKMILGSGADAGDGGTDVRTNFLATTTGTYYLAAGGTADMTGTYRMEVRPAGITDDVVANVTTTASMVSGSTYTGQIETIGDRDWIRVDLAANKTFQIRMDASTQSLGAVTMPVIANVFKDTGEAVYLNPIDPGAGKETLSSIREFTSTAAGTYYIEVKSLNEGIGGYRVQVTESASYSATAPELLGDFIDRVATTPTTQAELAALPHYSTSVTVDGAITLTFGKPKNQDLVSNFVEEYLDCDIFKGSGKITLIGGAQTLEIDVNSDQVSILGNKVTINPDIDFLPDTEYAVIVDAGTFMDATGTPFAGIGVERSTTFFDVSDNVLGTVLGIDLSRVKTYTWLTKTINDPNEFLFKTAPLSLTPAKDDWTIMVYMAADNELEGQALADLREMFSAQLPNNVNVVVMVDRAAGYDTSDGNWTGAYQGMVQQGMTVADVATQWTSLGEVNTGGKATLQNFITSVKGNTVYAADHYGLVVWGPGGGTSGTGWDYSAGMDNLSLGELREAMTGAGMTASVTLPSSTTPGTPKLIGAALGGDGGQVVLTYDQAIFNLASTDGTADAVRPFTGAFEYSLDGGTSWHTVVGWSVNASAVTLDLGTSVHSGESVSVRYNAAYNPSYVHNYVKFTYVANGIDLTDIPYTGTEKTPAGFSALSSSDRTQSADSFTISMTDNKFDLLAFDSSLMGLTETLWEVKDNVHQVVASEDIVPSTGFDYQAWLTQLANNTSMPSSELASKLVLTYFDQNAGGISASMAAYDIDHIMANQNGAGIPKILSAINVFADYAIKNGTAVEWNVIHDAAVNAITSPTHDSQVDYLRDVSDFFQYLWVYLPNGNLFKLANDALQTVVDTASTSKTLDSGSVGLGIYMPLGMPVDPNYTGSYLTFLNTPYGTSGGAALTPQWDEFVQKLQTDLSNKAPTNLTLTPEFALGSSPHLAEIVSAANGYKLTSDLRVATISFTDDAWQNSNVIVRSASAAGDFDYTNFKIVDDGLYLRKGTLLNYEAVSDHAYAVTVTLSDPTVVGSTPTSATFTLTIDNLDEAAPVMTTSVSVRVAENMATSMVVFDANATDDIGIASYSLKAVGDYAAFEINATTGEVTFKASPDYEAKDLYRFTVVAQDAVGNRAEEVVSLKVTDAADGGVDTRGPIVTTFSPADNTTKVALNSHIVLNFNEAIARGTGNVVLKKLNGTVVETFAANSSHLSISNDAANDTYSLSIDPTLQLDNNTMYVVAFDSGVVTDTSANHNAMQDVGVYNFRTVAGITGVTTANPDTESPALLSSVPADNASNVDVTNNITMYFSEAIQRGNGSVVIKTAAGVVVETLDVVSSDRITINNDLTNHVYSLTINPTDNLKVSTEYVITFENGAVLDSAGNGYVDSGAYNFTTAAHGAFNIELIFTNGPGGTGGAAAWADEIKQYFYAAKARWEDIIVGDLPNVGTIDDMQIEIVESTMSGGVLATGGFTAAHEVNGHLLPYMGKVNADASILMNQSDAGKLILLTHEIGHALGVGTLWGGNNLNSVFGQYTGENALDAYRELTGNAAAEYIPLDTAALGHWDYDSFTSSTMGEVMTGGLNASLAQGQVVSKITAASMMDLGYEVNMSSAEIDQNYHLANSVMAPRVDVSYSGEIAMQQGYAVI